MSQNKHTKRETIKGKEINTLRYGIATRLKVGVAFPAIYSIAMSNLAFQTILKTFNDVPDTLAHRFVFPEPLELSKMISPRGQIRSIETSEPMYNYDIIAFSLNYENDIINALQMIDLGNIPLRCDKRSKQHPLVILGGVVPTLNPEPFADFFDIILLGESESIIPRICKVLSETYSLNRIRYEALESASTLECAYVPKWFKPLFSDNGALTDIQIEKSQKSQQLKRHVIRDLDKYEGHTRIYSPDTQFSKMQLNEVSRGCPKTCRYCIINTTYSPYRYRSAAQVIRSALSAPPDYRIGLLGAGISEHPDLHRICDHLSSVKRSFSFSSLQSHVITSSMMKLISSYGPKTLTFAPETGSDKRRHKIGKDLKNSELLDAMRMIAEHDILKVKFYFMIGLPGECQSDVQAIISLCKKIQHVFLSAMKHRKQATKITVSISCFVPKAQSQFENAAMEDIKSLGQKIKFISTELKSLKACTFVHDIPKWAYIQGLIARGDRRLCDTLEQIAQKKISWNRALKTMPINPGYFVNRRMFPTERKAWDLFRYSIMMD